MSQGKNFKCFAGRGSLIGDTVMFLPVLNFLETVFPDSYKIFPISKKTCQSAPLFINHPLIDKIHILSEYESMGSLDLDLAKTCQIAINPFPQHPPCPGLTVGIDNFWYNEFTCVEETVRMAGLSVCAFKSLPKEMHVPRLSKWFPIEKISKSISIWPFAAYGKELARSPSLDWWNNIVTDLIKIGFNVYVMGHPNDPSLNILNNVFDKRDLPFFEQIKMALGCDLCINTDSGSGWVIGAYGHNQISLIANHAPNHTKNLNAFAPLNSEGRNINLFEFGGCSNINSGKVLDSIKTILG